ncbi:MAG: helix-turn-helix transcriptional regulator [Bradymonadaceae bacterium]|nr:helix-turn-helix transcriptional regulator [Lujinxingiaceae bacterium]
MKQEKRERLEKAGWKVGTATEFLGLTPADEALIELRLALAHDIRKRRQELGVTQAEFASRVGSDQSRISRIERNDATVSLDILLESLLALGATKQDIGSIIAQS